MLRIIVASVVVAILMLGIGDSFLPIMDQVLLAAADADEPEEPLLIKGIATLRLVPALMKRVENLWHQEVSI